MAVFENCSVFLELRNLPFKERRRLKAAVTEHGGDVSFLINKQCTLVVTSDVANLSSRRLQSIQKYQTPVVGVDFVHSCLERGALLPVDEYKLDTSSPSAISPDLPPQRHRGPLTHEVSRDVPELSKGRAEGMDTESPTQEMSGTILGKFRIYTEQETDLPTFPDGFQVAHYSIFQMMNSSTWCVLELQSFRGKEAQQQYRVVRYWKDDVEARKAAVRDMLVFLSTSEEALEVYQALRDTLQASGLQLRTSISPQAPDLGSAPFQQLLLEEKLNTGVLSQDVGVFVELLWTEALGFLGNILSVSIDKLSLNDVSRVEGLLIQAQRKQREENHAEVASLLGEVYTLLPHRGPSPPPTAKLISQKLDLCQLIRDILNVSEMTLRSPAPSCLGKYRALRCSIESVPPGSSDFKAVTSLLQDSKLQIQQVLRVSRGVELETFKSELRNIKPLLHSSSPSNFVGILSRGLLLPCVGVEHHGIDRTDVGNLGGGIYFSDAMSTCLKYSKPSETDGSRLLLVCDVALGGCKDVHKKDTTLTQAPEGHDSLHAVRHSPKTPSDFEDDEYVVYSPDQVKLKYVVQFSVGRDELKEFSPSINTSAELCPPSAGRVMSSEDDDGDEVESIKNPLEDVKAGLLDSAGQQLPLQAVSVKCKLMDLLSQVIIFQTYANLSSVPIEAKYVFPLDGGAAVCGFEAFINGKHVVGQVKEKETARKEYKQAIERGHGAYLMDQDAPDVFTISIGNLPPGATVLIKVTFVSELIVRDGSVVFSLPGSVAPWQEGEALNQTTQVTVEKVCVTDEAAGAREFSLDMSVEMPNKITSLNCITHKVKMKRTACKAVVSVLPGQVMGPEGFQLSITLSEVHLPRMWVENHPDKDSQACMLVFYPDFDINPSSASDEVVLLLDTSESMRGETLSAARRIALQVLKTLDHNLRINVILFGTDHSQAFLAAQPLVEGRRAAENFIKNLSPVGGSTELWRPLRALSLLPPSRGVRNLLLLSDGHIQNAALTLQLLRDNAAHSRLFTCGLSSTANRHMLRALAQAGGGAYEFFDTKTKHTWAEKVACQVKRVASPGCSSVSVKWQQFHPEAPPPVQAPKQLHALFNDCHTLVYGFVPHCTQATLLGNLSGRELETMVSTSELQKSRGTFLHKLTARALIKDYEDGNLDSNEGEHEGKKTELKSFIIELSKEFSILSQFTSFVAIEERDSEQPREAFTDITKLIAEEDVDFLSYISWMSHRESTEEEYSEEDMCLDLMCDMEEDDLQLEEEVTVSPAYLPMSLCYTHVPLDGGSVVESAAMERSPNVKGGRMKRDLCGIPNKSNFPFPVLKGHPPPPPPPPPAPPAPPALDHLSGRALVDARRLPLIIGHRPPPPPAPPALRIPSERAFRAGHILSVSNGHPPPPPPPPPAPPALDHLSGRALVDARRLPLIIGHRPPPPPAPPAPPALDHPSGRALVDARRLPLIIGHQPPPPPAPPAPPALDHPSGRALFSAQQTSDQEPVDLSEGFGGAFSGPPVMNHLWRAESFDAIHTDGNLFGAQTFSPASETVPAAYESLGWSARSGSGLFGGPSMTTDLSFGGSMAERQSGVYVPNTLFDFNFVASEPDEVQPRGRDHSVEYVSQTPAPMSTRLLKGRAGRKSSRPFRMAQEEPVIVREPTLTYKRRSLRPPDSLIRYSSSQEAPSIPGDVYTRRPDDLKLRWTKIFQMQRSEGYWELTTELGTYMNVNVDVFADVFLRSRGINSLGMRAHGDILRLVATLLVLQVMRVERLEEGKLLRTLFCLEDSSELRPEWWEEVKKAVDWVRWADRQYPCIYSRLEFGVSWESATRQLLGYDGLPPFSPLSDLHLRMTSVPLPVQ